MNTEEKGTKYTDKQEFLDDISETIKDNTEHLITAKKVRYALNSIIETFWKPTTCSLTGNAFFVIHTNESAGSITVFCNSDTKENVYLLLKSLIGSSFYFTSQYSNTSSFYVPTIEKQVIKDVEKSDNGYITVYVNDSSLVCENSCCMYVINENDKATLFYETYNNNYYLGVNVPEGIDILSFEPTTIYSNNNNIYISLFKKDNMYDGDTIRLVTVKKSVFCPITCDDIEKFGATGIIRAISNGNNFTSNYKFIDFLYWKNNWLTDDY